MTTIFTFHKVVGAQPIAVVEQKPVEVEDGDRMVWEEVGQVKHPLLGKVLYVAPAGSVPEEKKSKKDFLDEDEVERAFFKGRAGNKLLDDDYRHLKEHFDDDQFESKYEKRPKKKQKVKHARRQVEEAIEQAQRRIKLPPQLMFWALPNLNPSQHDVIYIFGKSGSGKTYWSAHYISLWKRLHPHHSDRVFIVSEGTVDAGIDYLDPIQIPLNDKFVEQWGSEKNPDTEEGKALEESTIDQFKNSCILFDDYMAISNKKVMQAVLNFQNKLLHMGRKHHIDLLITVHDAMAYAKTKKALVDVGRYVTFPGRSNWRQIEAVLTKYACMKKTDIAHIESAGRNNPFSCVVSGQYPTYVLTSNEAFFAG